MRGIVVTRGESECVCNKQKRLEKVVRNLSGEKEEAYVSGERCVKTTSRNNVDM